jgi:phenylacetate-CoA ligase
MRWGSGALERALWWTWHLGVFSAVIIDSPRRREQLAAVAKRLPAHVARLAWSQDQIKAERQRALRETLAFAKTKSPWHAERLSRVDADSFTEADLARLPVMTKADVMSNWDELVTDRRLSLSGCNADITAKLEGKTKDYYYLDDYLVIATGGSSGVRGVFPWSWDEYIEIACATFRDQLRDEPPERLTGRRLLAVIEAGQIVHGSPFLFSVSTDPEAEVKWIPADTPLDALVASLNEARPTPDQLLRVGDGRARCGRACRTSQDQPAPRDHELRAAPA